MMHSNTAKYVRELKDANGRYLFRPRNDAGGSDWLDGHPVVYNLHFPSSITPGSTPIAFGDFSRFHIRDVRTGRLKLATETYGDIDQLLSQFLLRSACVLMDAGTHPVVYLQQHS